MAYAIFNSDNMAATTLGSLHTMFKITEADGLQNGSVVTSTNVLLTGERELNEYTAPVIGADLSTVRILATPEVTTRSTIITDFTNAQDTVALGLGLMAGDIFSLSADGFTGTPAIGSIVELDGTTKLSIAATATSGSTKIGTIIEIGANNMVAVKVG